MDFGTTVTAMPRVGLSPPNLILDPAQATPDMSSPYIDGPFPFPALTFVTTAARMVKRHIPTFTPSTPIIEFAQFPPGDPSLIGIGFDSNGRRYSGLNGWSIDGFTTKTHIISLGDWGMRAQ